MTLLCRIWHHKWTFPEPAMHRGVLTLWRGCRRCGSTEWQTIDGRWKRES